MPVKSKSPLKTLVNKADKVFSLYIRNRDAVTEVEDKDGNWVLAGKCITCPNVIAISKAHAGHFIPRGCKLTRYSETNVNLQCPGCNTYKYGEQYKHGREIDRKFGAGTADRLQELEARYKKDGHKWSHEELIGVIERFEV